jgi:hypothetical protein
MVSILPMTIAQAAPQLDYFRRSRLQLLTSTLNEDGQSTITATHKDAEEI